MVPLRSAAYAGILLSIASAAPLRAGGGPETTAVVIDAGSTLSLAVGLRYAELRGIPAANLLFLDGLDGAALLELEVFRERIEKPLRALLRSRDADSAIDTVALSVDLPFGVDLGAFLAGREKPPSATPRASATGLLYLGGFHDLSALDWLALDANPYAQAEIRRENDVPRVELPSTGRAFRDELAGRSAMVVSLGWIGARGNRLSEVLDALERARAADASQPRGTVYLLESLDVRARSRSPYFERTADLLRELGIGAAVLRSGEDGQDGVIPKGKRDVLGLVAGCSDFDWSASGSALLPGALAENLTSFGAAFDQPGQTKIASFVRAGAAGTSGTVYEPYALLPKFPHPFLHVYYAQGFSLAEAFHLAVASPFQLLVIGDPLARPFGRFTDVELEGAPGSAPWQGRLEIRVRCPRAKDGDIAAVELWCDGRRCARGAADAPLVLDTFVLGEGGHELHAVAIGSDAARTRSTVRRVIEVRNRASRFAPFETPRALSWSAALELAVSHASASRVELWRGEQRLLELARDHERFAGALPTSFLGPGVSWAHLRAFDSKSMLERSALLRIEVLEPVPSIAATSVTREGWLPGLRARCRGPRGEEELAVATFVPGDDRGLRDRFRALGGAPSALSFSGEIRLDEGWNQLALSGVAEATLELPGFAREGGGAASSGTSRWCGFAVAGWHPFRLELVPSPSGEIAWRVQGSGEAAHFEGARLRHAHPYEKGYLTADEISPALGDVLDAENGLVLQWKEPREHLAAVVLHFPEGAREARPAPSAWFVETRANATAAWAEVREARAVVCPALARPLNKHQATAWISFEFAPTAARELRVRPVLSHSRQQARLAGIETYEAH